MTFSFIASLPTTFLGHRPVHNAVKSITKTWIEATILWKIWNMWHLLKTWSISMPIGGVKCPNLACKCLYLDVHLVGVKMNGFGTSRWQMLPISLEYMCQASPDAPEVWANMPVVMSSASRSPMNHFNSQVKSGDLSIWKVYYERGLSGWNEPGWTVAVDDLFTLVAYIFLGPAAANPTKKSGHHELKPCNNCEGKSRMSPVPLRSISTRVEALAQLPGKVYGPVDLEMFRGKNVDIMRHAYIVSCGRAVERFVH